mgnify:CR=1 FL=1
MGRKLRLGVLVAFFVLMLSACTYAGTYRLTVNKGTNCVTVYEKQGNNYVPIKAMICSVGANDGTPSGVFNTCAKYTWRPTFWKCIWSVCHKNKRKYSFSIQFIIKKLTYLLSRQLSTTSWGQACF